MASQRGRTRSGGFRTGSSGFPTVSSAGEWVPHLLVNTLSTNRTMPPASGGTDQEIAGRQTAAQDAGVWPEDRFGTGGGQENAPPRRHRPFRCHEYLLHSLHLCAHRMSG